MNTKAIKAPSVVLFSIILLSALTVILLRQYFAYQKESNDYKSQIRIYEEIYLKDRNQLAKKRVEAIQDLIDNTDDQLKQCSYLLPENTYLNLYKFIHGIKQLFVSNGVVFELKNIESATKDFYEEIYYSVSLSGKLSDITGCIDQMIIQNALLFLNDACILNNKADDRPVINLDFKAYMFIGPGKSEKMVTGIKSPLAERKIKTWLPPFSIWVKADKERAMELKQMEKARQDLKLKLDMFETYKKKRKKLLALETIIEHLGNQNRRSNVSVHDLSPCTP